MKWFKGISMFSFGVLVGVVYGATVATLTAFVILTP